MPRSKTVVSPSVRSARGRAEVRLLGGIGAQAVAEAVAEIVGEVEPVAVGHRPVAFRQLGMALGEDAFGGLVVDDLVGLERAALVVDAHVALRRHGVGVGVLDELVGLHQHLVGLLGGCGRLGYGGGLRPCGIGRCGMCQLATPPAATREPRR